MILETIQSGDTYNGKVLKGSLAGLCPVCEMALPLQIVVSENTLDTQSVTNVCSNCGTIVLAYKRNRTTGDVIDRHVHPKLEGFVKARGEAIHEWQKAHQRPLNGEIAVPGKEVAAPGKILLPGAEDPDLLTLQDLTD